MISARKILFHNKVLIFQKKKVASNFPSARKLDFAFSGGAWKNAAFGVRKNAMALSNLAKFNGSTSKKFPQKKSYPLKFNKVRAQKILEVLATFCKNGSVEKIRGGFWGKIFKNLDF